MPWVRALLLLALLAWLSTLSWNLFKPLPPATHVTSMPVRLGESQIAVLAGTEQRPDILARELAAVERAGELIVIDLYPLPRELGQRLLLRQRQRPNIKIVVVSDPRAEAQGGTPAEYLDALERAGVIVARVRLERLRDPNPLYSALWRLTLGWWSDPFDEALDKTGVRASFRALNFKADERQLLVADDGAGGWVSILPASAAGDLAVELSGALARDIAASELQVAGWSSDDDRLPAPPPRQGPGWGSIDARFLTEGGIRAAMLDAVSAAGAGDEISLAARAIGDRRLIGAALRAAARGTRIRVLLEPSVEPNAAAAGELERGGDGRIEVRWSASRLAALALVRRRSEWWASLGSKDFTRPSLGDFNLEAAVEFRLPERSAAARALSDHFAAGWAAGRPNSRAAHDSSAAYWRYRVFEATGLAPF